MTPEAQRIAIAEACGWTNFSKSESPDFWYAPGERHKELWRTHRLPDYLKDLNAVHDAEKTLNEVDRVTYFRQLETIVDRDIGRVIAFAVGDANASQRAEAFLRVKGLWK